MSSKCQREKNTELVAFWLPKPLLAALDDCVKKQDSDRSKYLRNAVREKLLGDGKATAELSQPVAA